MVLEHFSVKSESTLEIPISHSTLPYPRTDIYITLDPTYKNHEDRDFSDIFQIDVYNKNNNKEKIKAIYDLNGQGRDIQVSFENKKPKINKIQITFKANCSGAIKVLSWQPL